VTSRKTEVAAAVRELIAGRRYDKFSVQAVAARARVDPDEVLQARDVIVDVLAQTDAITEIPDQGSTRRELAEAVRLAFHLNLTQHNFDRVLSAFAPDRDSYDVLLEQVRQKAWQYSREPIAAALQRAADRGDLPPDVDTDLIQDMWAGTLTYRRQVSGNVVNADLVGRLVDLTLTGIPPLRDPEIAESAPIAEWPWWMRKSLRWLDGIAFGHVLRADAVPLTALAAAPPAATLSGRPVTMSAGAGRDFMPSVDDVSDCLSVGVEIVAERGGMLPPALRADRVIVVHGDEVWVAPLVERNPWTRTSRRFTAVANRGPKWPPGARLDVVASLTEAGSAAMHLLRSADVPIEQYC
jgi:hypothetical protein